MLSSQGAGLPEVQGLVQGEYVSKRQSQDPNLLSSSDSNLSNSSLSPQVSQCLRSLKELQSKNDKILYFKPAAFSAMEKPREESLILSLSSVKS